VKSLPVMTQFDERSADGFTLDQRDDVMLTVQAFLEEGVVAFEIWGNTTLILPSGERHETRRYKQVSSATFVDGEAFHWQATRTVWDDVPWADDDPTPEATQETPTRDDLPEYVVHIRYADGRLARPGFKKSVEFVAVGTDEDVHEHLLI
jgi:hypothetical protein